MGGLEAVISRDLVRSLMSAFRTQLVRCRWAWGVAGFGNLGLTPWENDEIEGLSRLAPQLDSLAEHLEVLGKCVGESVEVGSSYVAEWD